MDVSGGRGLQSGFSWNRYISPASIRAYGFAKNSFHVLLDFLFT